jgi:hypothetical protein
MTAAVPAARLWGRPVLALVAQVAPGAKLHLGDRLDRATLRPPPARVIAPAPPLRPNGQQLYRELKEAGVKRGLGVTTVSLQAFGNRSQMSVMQHALRPVRDATWAKAQAWLQGEPRPVTPPRAPAPPPSAPSRRANGAALAAQLTALVTQHDLSKTRVSQHLFGGIKGGIAKLAKVTPKPATVARVEAFLAAPPLDHFRRQRAPARPRASTTPVAPVHPRDPTERPPTPELDAADRRRATAMRHVAAQARGREQAATDLIDAGVDPASQSTTVANQMRAILRRRADEARQHKPSEQAKLALRQRGRVVFDASVVDGGRQGRFFVNGQVDDAGKRKQLTEAQLIALAWRVNPRRMEQLTGEKQP